MLLWSDRRCPRDSHCQVKWRQSVARRPLKNRLGQIHHHRGTENTEARDFPAHFEIRASKPQLRTTDCTDHTDIELKSTLRVTNRHSGPDRAFRQLLSA